MSTIGRVNSTRILKYIPASSYHSNIILSKMAKLRTEILMVLRTNYDKPNIMKELFKRLQNVDSMLQRMTIMVVVPMEVMELVLVNKETLIVLRTNLDKPNIMKELFKRMQNVDSVLQRMTIMVVYLHNQQQAATTTTTIIPCPEGEGGPKGETGTNAKTVASQH